MNISEQKRAIPGSTQPHASFHFNLSASPFHARVGKCFGANVELQILQKFDGSAGRLDVALRGAKQGGQVNSLSKKHPSYTHISREHRAVSASRNVQGASQKPAHTHRVTNAHLGRCRIQVIADWAIAV